MTDVAGVVLGVAALWKTCIQVFETIDASQKYGIDYEVLCVKLEVERMRLLNWGEAVGISEESQESAVHPDLSKQHIQQTVTRVLGCIQSIFVGTESLQTRYGLELKPATNDEATTPASRIILASVFKESYERLLSHARDRQKATKLGRRTLWAIKDKTKFREMIVEIRGFNDSLEAMFRGVREDTESRMLRDISRSDNTVELQLVQDAMAGEHQNLSDEASARIELLTMTYGSTARTELLTDEAETVLPRESYQDEAATPKTMKGHGNKADYEWDKLTSEVEGYVGTKRKGYLVVTRRGPTSWSSIVKIVCEWEGKPLAGVRKGQPDRMHGDIVSKHAAFDAYWKKRYMKASLEADSEQSGYANTAEARVLFDVESYPEYEHVRPGTLTPEGFGLEAWQHEELYDPKGERYDRSNYAFTGYIPGERLLLRVHQLQTALPRWGWKMQEDKENLIEFMGSDDMEPEVPGNKYGLYLSKFYGWLNRRDIIVNVMSKSSFTSVCSLNDMKAFWYMMWQIIVGYELGRRLKQYLASDNPVAGLTPNILATVIIADTFIDNVKVELLDPKVRPDDQRKPASPEEATKAEDFKIKGNDAMAKKDFDKAVESYTAAIDIDATDAVYRCNRSAAHYELGDFKFALKDAYLSTLLDPKYAKAWSRFAASCLKTGREKQAKEAYQRAGQYQADANKQVIETGLARVEAAMDARWSAINKEEDSSKHHMLRKEYLSQDWDTMFMLRGLKLHSKVHERQVEGLLFFAELIKWPYINETREVAEEAYSNREVKDLPSDLNDWLFGLMLPGKWFANTIMAALIRCTPSLADSPGVAPFLSCGFSTPTRTYWRSRTVLYKVLGCLPDVQSICGWLGPCPPVVFDPPLKDDTTCQHVLVKTRQVTPIAGDKHDLRKVDGIWRNDIKRGEGEELDHYIEEAIDPDKWLIPEPPVKDISTCNLKTIRLRKDSSSKRDFEVREDVVYRAQMLFQLDNHQDLIAYNLYTNPNFISPPPCHPGTQAAHEVHVRELHRFDHKHVWPIDKLKAHTAEASEESEVMIINATGKGSELLARAWCSERGKNAVIRTVGGPCYTCTVRAAGPNALGTGVVIWVSSDHA